MVALIFDSACTGVTYLSHHDGGVVTGNSSAGNSALHGVNSKLTNAEYAALERSLRRRAREEGRRAGEGGEQQESGRAGAQEESGRDPPPADGPDDGGVGVW